MANLIASLILIIALCVISWLYYQTKVSLTASLEKANEDNLKLKKLIVNFQKKYANNIEAEEGVIALQKEQIYINDKNKELKQNYSENKKVYDALRRDIVIYSEQLDLMHDGFYEPHFDFASSELYKAKILEVREKQKILIKDKSAVICNTEWTIGGSRSEGKKMTNKQIRLSLRAFNNECDAAIASTTWRNASKMEQRIKKSFEDINKLNEEQQVFVTSEYLNLKLQEFYLAHEHAEKRKEEQEERAELRQQAREEAKLEQEIQSALKEEDKYQRLLEKAKEQAQKESGLRLDVLQSKIAELSEELAEAHEKSERAMSMAQQTRAGYVYVISNIGSFGKDVYKIGMTRRLDPMDRVRELGDASVPFGFDVHALIYSEDAPALENMLHKEFAEHRLNLKNYRREFFAVPLVNIEKAVKTRFPDAEIVLDAEAQDYYESIALREQYAELQKIEVPESFPTELV